MKLKLLITALVAVTITAQVIAGAKCTIVYNNGENVLDRNGNKIQYTSNNARCSCATVPAGIANHKLVAWACEQGYNSSTLAGKKGRRFNAKAAEGASKIGKSIIDSSARTNLGF